MRGDLVMDLSFIDKDSRMMPMLVKLHDSHKLYSLAKDKKPLAKAELSSAMAELIGMETNLREEELISDVMIALMRQAEKDLRAALSEKLSGMETVPLRLALHLANDEIDIATPMLEKSTALGDMDLIYIIKSKTTEYWQAIAKRKSMSNQLINILAETRDIPTAQKLVENMDIVLPEDAMKNIAVVAAEEQDLAKSLLHRKELSDDVAVKLYSIVGHELKQYIARNFDLPSDIVASAVDEVVLEFKEIAVSEYTPSKAMLNAAMRFKEQGMLNTSMMLTTLRRGQIQSFIAQFSVFSNVPLAIVEKFLSHPNGNGLAVLCKANDILKPDFVTMFLLTNRLRNKGRMVEVADMNRAVQIYNKLSKDMSMGVLRSAVRKD